MSTKNLPLATLVPCILVALQFVTVALGAQIPPSVDPSQVVSGSTSAGHYDYALKDGTLSQGTVINNVDPRTGSGVIITIPDNGNTTTTLVHPGLSVMGICLHRVGS